MAIVMLMSWPGISLEQYEAVRQKVQWETNVPTGAQYHVAAHDGANLRVTDVWDNPEQFQAFSEQRLMPVIMEMGITSQPSIEIYPAYATFAPNAK